MAIDCANSRLVVTPLHADLSAMTACTMMAWIQVDSYSEGRILNLDKVDTASFYLTIVPGTPNRLRMYVRYSSTATYGDAAAPAVGVWVHACGRWRHVEGDPSASRPDVFINGLDATSWRQTPSGTLVNAATRLCLANNSTSTRPFDGKMADAVVFNRRLSDSEIRAIAQGRIRPTGLGPVFHMPLEGSSGVAAIGDVGLRDLTDRGGHVVWIDNAPSYYRDPPLHWPMGPQAIRYAGRTTRNARPTMNVAAGTKLATMRRAV